MSKSTNQLMKHDWLLLRYCLVYQAISALFRQQITSYVMWVVVCMFIFLFDYIIVSYFKTVLLFFFVSFQLLVSVSQASYVPLIIFFYKCMPSRSPFWSNMHVNIHVKFRNMTEDITSITHHANEHSAIVSQPIIGDTQ